MLQPLELNCDVDFLLNFMDFFAVLKSFEFQSDRVLLSLNGIKDVKTRLLSKAEYIISTHRKFYWYISINKVVIYIPWKNGDSEGYNLVLELGSLLYTSKFGPDAVSSSTEERSHILQQLPGFHMQELYDYSEVKLNNFQSKLMMPQCPQPINILERFCASLTLVTCIISDESILKQLEVYIVLPSLDASFSLSLLESFVALVEHLQAIQSRSGCLMLKSPSFPKVLSSKSAAPIFGFSIVAKLHSVSLHVDLANDGENSSELLFSLQEFYIRYVHTELEECWVCSKALKIIFSPLKGQSHSHILYSSGHQYTSSSSHQQELGFSHKCVCTEASFLLHYEAHQDVDLIFHKFTVDLNDAEIHCFPFIFQLLFGFYNRLVVYAASFARRSSLSPIMGNKIPIKMPGFQFQKFGYSNFLETGSSDYASISLDSYPFVTICNSGSLGNPESSFCNSMPDWRRLFNLRDGKPRSPKLGLMEGAKTHDDLAFVYKSRTDASPVSESFQDLSLFNTDINLGGIRVHFHDSSCIVGTVALASCKLSLVVCEDSMDLLCSAEGLNLTSSWWTNNLKEFLWGPSLPNLSPLLNVRLRKGNVVSSTSALEVSIGIQHVLCILPSKYLAIIIGYFSLPEWSSYLREQLNTDDHKGVALENESQIVYKFEILDSTLILPVDHDDHRFLKIELPQLYGSFIHNCASDDLLKDIPPQNMVPVHKVAKTSHCLNIFGRDLYLSLLLLKDDECGHLMAHWDIEPNNIPLIEPVSADVWVRLPHERAGCSRSSSVFTCIMSRIITCQLIADDCNRLNGIEALLDVINQFASVDVESKYFTSDVLHFLQLKRSLKESGAFSPLSFGPFLTEVQCSVESLVITLYHQRDNATALEPVVKADMQFLFSASLINDTPASMDLRLSFLTLQSVLNSVMLMQCIDSCSVFSAVHICFSKSVEGANDLHVSLPSLDIWLHMFDWTAIIDLAMNISKKKVETAPVEAPSKSSPEDIVDPAKSVAVTDCQTFLDRISMQQVLEEQNSILMVRSEDIGITIHFPILLSKSRIAEFKEWKRQNVSSNSIAVKDCNFLAITVHCQNSKLSMASGSLQMKFSLGKTSGSLGICEDKRITTWPFFQISQINLVTHSSKNQMELVSVNLGVECNQLDVWLSHRVFCFWHDISFDIPELASPQSSFCSMDFRIELRKASLLISDERWTCGGPLLEILLGNVLLLSMMTENSIKCSVDSNLDINYNNIHKVLWEPFVEPWKFQINVIRKQETTALLSSSMITDIHLSSTAQLNLNFTESLIECICRTSDMIKDSICSMQPDEPCENQRFLGSQHTENVSGGRYAPYVLQNLTSLPLVYYVSEGFVNSDEFEASQKKDGKFVDPGASVPIFLHKTPEEQLFCQGPAQSSNRLSEKQLNVVVHHFMSIQLDGTSLPSAPISMDRVGLTYFDVDFSKISNEMDVSKEEGVSNYAMHIKENAGFVVPVVFDVTMQRYNKLIRVYSTVILSNATSMPLELRFDIPFGVSPKILDPIAPGQKFPLPLHLAEAGRMRWRPHGRSYLWSEVYDLSNIISQESQFGFLRSFVCYPSHPSSDPFRCCVSVQNFGLHSSRKPKRGLSLPIDCTLKGLMESSDYEQGKLKKKFIHQLTLSTPLVVNSYLPDPVLMTIESGGVTHTVLLSEEGTSFHHVDPLHDVGLELYMHGFRPSSFKFSCTETFGAVAKFNGTKFSQTETITFNPDSSHGQLYVTMEKMMDAFSGAREIFICVPFILYNCTGLPLNIAESAASMRANYCSIPSSYNLIQQKAIQEKKDGLCLFASKQDSPTGAPQIDGLRNSFSNNHIFLASKDSKSLSGGLINKSFIISGSSKPTYKQSDDHDLVAQETSLNRSTGRLTLRNSGFGDTEHGKVKACMYSPCEISSVAEIMVRVCACLPERIVENVPNLLWSDPFLLVPPSGSNTVLIPQSSSNAAFIISVTSSTLIGSVAGQTRVITFQPRL
uniref:Uncharacterized protein LOC105135080 isoform X1 n=1 Tax=Rhizophora mucronata TaxID=61149 RepID=A0A2P2MK19_RHIMU